MIHYILKIIESFPIQSTLHDRKIITSISSRICICICIVRFQVHTYCLTIFDLLNSKLLFVTLRYNNNNNI